MLSRFRRQTMLFAVLPFVLLLVVDVPVLIVAEFVLGLGIAPALIAAFGLCQQIVPARSLTEGLSWINTGLGVGYGAGAALVGGIADHYGARTAFLTVLGSAVLVGVLGAALHRRIRSQQRPAEPVAAGLR